MNRLLQAAKLGCWVLLALLLLAAIRVLERVETSLDRVDDAVIDLRGQLGGVTSEATVTLATATATLDSLDATIEDSRRPLAKILLHTDATVGRAAITMQHLESMASGLKAQQEALDEQQTQLFARGFKLADSADIAVHNLSKLESDSDVLVLNPDIKLTLASLRDLADNSDQTTAHLNHTAASFDAYVQRLLKPASTLKQIGRTALGFSEGVVAKAIP